MGRGDVWDGDAGTSNTGTQGTRDVNDSDFFYRLCGLQTKMEYTPMIII